MFNQLFDLFFISICYMYLPYSTHHRQDVIQGQFLEEYNVFKSWIFLLLDLLFSSSSCSAIGAGIPDPLSPPFSVVHCFEQVFKATSRIGTELLYVGSSWSFCLCSPCEGVHRSTSLMSSSLLLLQYPACLIRLTLIVFVMTGKWP